MNANNLRLKLSIARLENAKAQLAKSIAKRQKLMPNSYQPWAVYRCDLIGHCEVPQNENFISGHMTPSDAMTEANRLKRTDRNHSYTVGAA